MAKSKTTAKTTAATENKVVTTTNMPVTKAIVELDSFNDFTNEVEGSEELNMSDRVIKGMKLKFLDPRWLDATGKDITGTLLTAIEVVNVVNKWGHDNKPLVVRVLAPGVRFPNFAELNAECDKSEWREKFGKLQGPWSGQHCIYFIDDLYNRYTWPSPTTTIGSSVAVREFADQVKLVRRLRGANVYPVVKLGHTDWPTGYGLKQRPYLLGIKRWVKLGPDQTQRALPAPEEIVEIAGGAPADAESVTTPTAAEEIDDEIQY
jgi:hypothetical protein